MFTNGEPGSTLPDDTLVLLSAGAVNSDDAVAALRVLLEKFTTTSPTTPTEEALRELGTAVGSDSMYSHSDQDAADVL